MRENFRLRLAALRFRGIAHGRSLGPGQSDKRRAGQQDRKSNLRESSGQGAFRLLEERSHGLSEVWFRSQYGAFYLKPPRGGRAGLFRFGQGDLFGDALPAAVAQIQVSMKRS